MRISYKCDYALKVVLYMSINNSKLVHLDEVARGQDIPRKFLELIFQELKKGGFLESKRGPKGGYYLRKEPKDIKLGDIVKFIEGSAYPISCIDPFINHKCNELKICVFAPIWKKVAESITNIIDGINFNDLALDAKCIKKQEKLRCSI